ncbi:MAG: hypothetical protein ACKO2P_21350 [Planctomycetota bacterium]
MDDFLQRLFETGDMLLPRRMDSSGSGAAMELLVKFESIWRCSWPGSPPDFRCDVALAASQVLMSMFQAVVFRDLELSESRQAVVVAGLATGDVVIPDPAMHYSVDLLFQFLPQLLDRAKRVSPSDGLIALLLDILQPWPLSSVGVAELTTHSPCPARLQILSDHPSLWQMYVDRVLQRGDRGCLQHLPTARAISAAIGPFDWLSGHLNDHLPSLGGALNSEGDRPGE